MDDLPATHEEQVAALEDIQQASEKLQKEGKYLEALQCQEKGLILRGHCYGLDSKEVHDACKKVGTMCNFVAMAYIDKNQLDIALELLKKAEVLSTRHRSVRAVTYNNMGCYYRKKKKLRTAMAMIQKALDLEMAINSPTVADTHLNMCTLLSDLDRHDKALGHARTALKLMLIELFGPQSNQQEDNKEKPPLPPDRVAVLAVAYHNLAVQEEFLGRFQDALTSYDKAVKVTKRHLGPDHGLVVNLTKSFEKAKKAAEAKNKKQSRILRGSGKPGPKPTSKNSAAT